MVERTEGTRARRSLGFGSGQVDSNDESDGDQYIPLVDDVKPTLTVGRPWYPTRAGVSNDLEDQVGKVTDQLWNIVKEKAAEIRALKKATDSLRKQLQEEKAHNRVHKAKMKAGRDQRKAKMAKAKKACEEAARALDVSMAKEEDSD